MKLFITFIVGKATKQFRKSINKMSKSAIAATPAVNQNPKTETTSVLKVVTSANGKPTNEIPKPEIKNPEMDLMKKIGKIADLQRTVIKRQTLRDTYENLQSFSLGTDKMQDLLTIEDSTGKEFKTSNSEVIKQVVDFLKKLIIEKTAEIDNELIGANI